MKNYSQLTDFDQINQAFNKVKLNRADETLKKEMGEAVHTSYQTSLNKIDAKRDAINKDKNDRATVDQVLDPRTLVVL